MFPLFNSPRRQLAAAHRVLADVAANSDIPIAVRLWDGSVVSLTNADCPLTIVIRSPGVIGALIRRPTLDNLLRQYATGGIDFEGGDLTEFADALRRGPQAKAAQLEQALAADRSAAAPFCPGRKTAS